MPIDIEAEAKKLREMYLSDERQKTFNFLVLGEMGVGKTFLLRTAVKPVHIDSWDPGGTKALEEYVRAGKIIVDSEYEGEDPKEPKMFNEWKRNFEHRHNGGYFEKIGTYAIDSSTMWSEGIMNYFLKKAGIAGQPPRFTKDYTPQKIEIRNYIRRMLDLPCHFAVTGHLELHKDMEDQLKFRYMTTGKGTVMLPLLFDEVYVLNTKETQGDVKYRLLTRTTDRYSARSRLAKDGKLDTYEDPDIKKLMKKAGLKVEDKPLIC
jgi:hypothetical protein